MEHIYSVIPLMEDHFEERLQDVIDQYERKITSCPLFMFTLVPEGDPAWDKAEVQCKIYKRYHDALAERKIPSAALIQSCIGHGNTSAAPAPFQKMIYLEDGEEGCGVYCPLDSDFLDYITAAVKKIAKIGPKAIMLDDDVRILLRRNGCACPLHMDAFNRQNQTSMTPSELREYIKAHGKRDALTRSYADIERKSVLNMVTRIREAIDSVDPTIQGINCTSGDICENVINTNPVFCGNGNPRIVRLPNGTYSPLTTKGFSDTMRRAAVCASKLKNHGIDIVLAETDTVPFNRYSKNARYLHAHFAASILEGCRGAKHWITRTTGYQMKSGKEFRNILAEHAGFYDKLGELADGIKWVGANSAFIEQSDDDHLFERASKWHWHENAFASCVFERLGIPFYFSERCEKASFFEGEIVRNMTDDQIEKFFGGSVFLSVEAAEVLIARGYGHLIGVDIKEKPEGMIVSGETFDGTIEIICSSQKKQKIIEPLSDSVKVLSSAFFKANGKAEPLFPAVTKFDRGDGRFSVVYCGEPKTEFTYTDAFSFLNETRKAQFIELLRDAGVLPVYCESDNEVCMRAGYIKDGSLLTALFNLGFDPEEKICYWLEKEPISAEILDKDGSLKSVSFKHLGNNIYQFDAKAEPMYPVFMLIK